MFYALYYLIDFKLHHTTARKDMSQSLNFLEVEDSKF